MTQQHRKCIICLEPTATPKGFYCEIHKKFLRNTGKQLVPRSDILPDYREGNKARGYKIKGGKDI